MNINQLNANKRAESNFNQMSQFTCCNVKQRPYLHISLHYHTCVHWQAQSRQYFAAELKSGCKKSQSMGIFRSNAHFHNPPTQNTAAITTQSRQNSNRPQHGQRGTRTRAYILAYFVARWKQRYKLLFLWLLIALRQTRHLIKSRSAQCAPPLLLCVCVCLCVWLSALIHA